MEIVGGPEFNCPNGGIVQVGSYPSGQLYN